MLNLEVTLSPDQTEIHYNQQSLITIAEKLPASQSLANGLWLIATHQRLTNIGVLTSSNPLPVLTEHQTLITFTDPDWTEQLTLLAQLLTEELPHLITTQPVVQIPSNYRASLQPVMAQILLILTRFGISVQQPADAKPTKAPAKTRHRWTKAVSEIPFQINTRQATGTAIWQKRNELLLQAGAHLMPEVPLNKDGSLGFAAKMGTQLRTEYADAIQNHQTTTDIIFKSVNELGLFLYFGGTNSWLELLDNDGRSIDDWTKI